MTAPKLDSSRDELRVHNDYDRAVSSALIKAHPEWSMEVIREASLICSNTVLMMLAQKQAPQTRSGLFKAIDKITDRYARAIAVSGMKVGFNKMAQKYARNQAKELDALIDQYIQAERTAAEVNPTEREKE